MPAPGSPVCRAMWISGRTCVALLRVKSLINQKPWAESLVLQAWVFIYFARAVWVPKAGHLEIVQIDDHSGRLQNQDLA